MNHKIWDSVSACGLHRLLRHRRRTCRHHLRRRNCFSKAQNKIWTKRSSRCFEQVRSSMRNLLPLYDLNLFDRSCLQLIC